MNLIAPLPGTQVRFQHVYAAKPLLTFSEEDRKDVDVTALFG